MNPCLSSPKNNNSFTDDAEPFEFHWPPPIKNSCNDDWNNRKLAESSPLSISSTNSMVPPGSPDTSLKVIYYRLNP